jgi:hypothetical protein
MEYTLRDGIEPNPNDVLCGRGGGTNNSEGNLNWRKLVALNKHVYTTLPKRQKMLLSNYIVSAVRSQEPPGRFLEKDTNSDAWYDVGDERAQRKTSQALRERLCNPTNQPASDASSEPSLSRLVAPRSQPPAPMPIPGNGHVATKSITTINADALPCPNIMMFPHGMTDYPEASTHQGDYQGIPPMVMNENVIIVPAQVVCSPTLSPPSAAPQGPVRTVTLTEREPVDLGSESLMSLVSFALAWQSDGGDPLTAMATTMSPQVEGTDGGSRQKVSKSLVTGQNRKLAGKHPKMSR